MQAAGFVIGHPELQQPPGDDERLVLQWHDVDALLLGQAVRLDPDPPAGVDLAASSVTTSPIRRRSQRQPQRQRRAAVESASSAAWAAAISSASRKMCR